MTDMDRQPSQKTSEPSVSVAILDQSLWANFRHAENTEQFLESWLGLLARQIDGLSNAVLVIGEAPDVGPFHVGAQWPVGTEVTSDLMDAVSKAIEGKKSVTFGEGESRRILAHPLIVFEQLFGAVAVSAPSTAPSTGALFRRLQWGEGWIEVLLRREQDVKDGDLRERVTVAFDMLATLLERPILNEAASALVTDLARRLDCETVSVGLRRRQRIKVSSVSSAASFGRRANLIGEIGRAMDEAADQAAVILWPEPEDWDFRVTREHEELAKSHGVGTVLTIPLMANDRAIGALTFERREGFPFSASDVDICDAVASIAGPILEDRRLSNRLLPTKIASSFIYMMKKLLGPRFFGAKLATLTLVGLISFFAVAKTDYAVTSPARLEGTVQRSIVAPFNGYLSAQNARAGDVVELGDIIAVLDEKDLALEKLRLSTELQQRDRELDRAIAERKLAEANIIRAQQSQIDAQIALVDEQLARTRIRAPFSGYIVEGDLSQSVGGSVERGQTLFRIAPLEGFRVVIEVNENDISEIEVGQIGSLRLAAFPELPLEYEITSITPLARQGDGRNYFLVEANLEEASDKLRPGMQGISRTEIEERSLFWAITHNLADWARLKLWKWQP